uniref:DUF659 domain-containing protein n=1 Tax=Latimeria chalumnae TaxID=7897 RepID=H3A950_LATCH
ILANHTGSPTDKHVKSTKHEKSIEVRESSEAKRKKQKTLESSFQSKSIASVEREEICEEWIKVCTAINLPLAAVDNPVLRSFLKERVCNGGAIPGSHQLSERYLPVVYASEKENLKKLLAVIFDEMPDAEEHCVLNILAAPLVPDTEGKVKSYMLNSVFLDKCNKSTVSIAVTNTLQEFNIQNENTVVFNTDNAAYMVAAYNTALKVSFPNVLHITCMAHIMNLVGESFWKPVKQLNDLMLHFSHMFYMAGSRKRRYLHFMHSKLQGTGKQATMAPKPVSTRWNSWYRAVQYHQQHFDFYQEFIEQEIMHCGKSAPNSVQSLNTILSDDTGRISLRVQINLVSAKCEIIVNTLDFFQSDTPVTLKAYDRLEELAIHFCCNGAKDMNMTTKLDIVKTCSSAYEDAGGKLEKYLSGAQPGITFLKEIRIFNPARVSLLTSEKAAYSNILNFSTIPDTDSEFMSYVTIYGPDAVKNSACNLLWSSMVDKMPKFSQVAKSLMYNLSNSANVERLNSMYKMILSSRRRRLAETTIKQLFFLHYNQKL